MKLTNSMLNDMHRFALTKYKDNAKDADESGDAFIARCWSEAFMDVIKGEGYDVKVISDKLAVPDWLESVSFTPSRVRR